MTLYEAIAEIEDPRKARGIRHSLGSVIMLVVTGLMSGYKDLAAISRWGRSLDETERKALGFNRIPPCGATLSNILRQLGSENLQQQLNKWLGPITDSGEHLALDGKTLRASHGSTINEQVHLLSLFCSKSGLVQADTAMLPGENEITCAKRLLKSIDLTGKVVTGDAIFGQKNSVN